MFIVLPKKKKKKSYGETYYISVCGINVIGKGKISTITFTNGKRKIVKFAHAHTLVSLLLIWRV